MYLTDQATLYMLKIAKDKEVIGTCKFYVDTDEKLLYSFSVLIPNEHKDMKIIELMVDTFTALFNHMFKGYDFRYRFGNPKFEAVVNRKVRQGKLPIEVIENRIFIDIPEIDFFG